jgi:hypothetical protein
MKKGYKLISPITKTGALTSRNGKKSFKIIKNEKNELFLHEPSFPQIHLKEFSKKDRDLIEKYFHKKSQHSRSSHSSRSMSRKKSYVVPKSSISTLSSKSFNEETDTVLPSGKKKYSVRKTYEEEKSDQKKERNIMASQDSRRISRLARIASKKQGKGARKTRRNRRI